MAQPLVEKSESEIAGLSIPLRALWYAAHDKWDAAHKLVQDDPTSESAWVHAYLHRVEGDIGNAHYWYRHAGKKPATDMSLDQELNSLIEAIGG
jgi:hypothetical protein